MMRKVFLLITLSLIISTINAYAGIYGSLKGKVVDEKGTPLAGASVRIEGTKLGAMVKTDGRFTIVNIPAGSYSVKVSMVGYPAYVVKVKVSADEVTEIDVKMEEKGVTTKEITVDASKDMVDKTEIGRKVKMTSDQIQSTAREGLASMVGLSAGVFNAGDGFNIRGSRSSETQIRVDGLDVGNQFQGGFGSAGITYSPLVSAFATEEVQVLTGGFSAEYGDAMGGVVNSVVKTGRNDRYEGFLRWRTDLPSLNGSQDKGLRLEKYNTYYRAVEDGEGKKLQGSYENKVEFGVGGPIPLLENSTFYLTGSNFFEKYRSNSYEIYDPWGNNLGLLPGNESYVKNITGKLKFSLDKDIDFFIGGQFGMSNFESNGWGWLYATTEGINPDGTKNGIPENIAKQNVINTNISNIYLRINHRLGNSFYELTLSNTSNNDESGRRKGWTTPNFFTGYDIWYPVDEYKVVNDQLVKGANQVLDNYEKPTKSNGKSKDGYLPGEEILINPLTGYIEGAGNSSGSNNPYGLPNFFATHGAAGGVSYRRGNYWQLDGNYNNLFQTGKFDHALKTGFEFRFYTMSLHSNSMPYDASPFYDIYSSDWGGNIYTVDEKTKEKTSKPYNPWRGSFYILDQVTYKGVIISPGVRLDIFSPNAKYRLPSLTFTPISSETGFEESSIKYQISPRINVTYPITDRSNISIAYGLYFKMPELQSLFDGFNTERLRGNQLLGDPNMEAQRQNTYQVSYVNQLTEDFALDVSFYYKDIYNQLGTKIVPTVPDLYNQYAVSEFGNSRGLEVSFRKRPVDHLSFAINYNLSYATGSSSSPESNYNPQIDPYSNTYAFPLVEFPYAYDRRHRINATISFFWGNNEGPSIAGLNILENAQINLTGFYQTGTPYTRTDATGRPISEYNAERRPSVWSTTLRLQKAFFLKDWFGDGLGNSSIEFFFDIENLLNNTQIVSYFSRTGDPNDDGVNFYRKQSDIGSSVAYYKEADFGRAESFQSDQYDSYGNRLYSPYADYDGNGIVTQEERFVSFIKYLETVRSFKGNYQAPRQVFFGLMFRF